MSRVPAKEMERKRDEPTGRDLVFVLPTNQTCDGREVCCFTPSPSAAISLSAHCDPEAALYLRAKLRRRTSGAH